VGGRARANQRRRREGACDSCCAEAERGRNGERGSGPTHAKRGGGPVHVAQRKTGPDGRQLHGRGEGGGRSGTCRMKQGKGWVRGPQLLWARPNRNIAVS
jgi:hypothetical protein